MSVTSCSAAGDSAATGHRIRFEPIRDDHERFAPVARPQEVLVGSTLQEQAQAFGDWVVRGFRAYTCPIEELRAAAR